ncbi:hypothetical protein HDE_08773 [Halotydeus destructor]|nr:hypothetical protein HDE_08773 [Halotydeus destructor]
MTTANLNGSSEANRDTNCTGFNNKLKAGNHSGKLGSDGESETSPDSSLSPIDVLDSSDELTSNEERQSPDGETGSESERDEARSATLYLVTLAEVSLLAKELPSPLAPTLSEVVPEKEQLIVAKIEEEKMVTSGQLPEPSSASPSSSSSTDCLLQSETSAEQERERQDNNLLSTVIEETEAEPDSLEEFIKHENDCLGKTTAEGSQLAAILSEEKNGQLAVDCEKDESVVKLIVGESEACEKKPLDTDHREQVNSDEITAQQVDDIPSGMLIESETLIDALQEKAIKAEVKDDIFTVNKFENSPFDVLQKDFVTHLSFEEIETPIEFRDDNLDNVEEVFVEKSEPETVSKTIEPELPAAKGEPEMKAAQNDNLPKCLQQKPRARKMVIGLDGTKTRTEAEMKIAQEILEFKRREDELRSQREESAKVVQQQQLAGNEAKLVCSETVSSDTEGRFSPSSELSTTESYGGRNSAQSLDSSTFSSSSITTTISTGKTDHLNDIKVKPLMDGANDDDHHDDASSESKPVKTENESPIEREIRMIQDRENELQSSKANLIKPGQTEKTVPGKITIPAVLRGPSVTGAGSIQKILATTRIQQEIEEQTQREMALRASGSIKTISQERTDPKVTKLGDVERSTSAIMTNCEPATKVAEQVAVVEEVKLEKKLSFVKNAVKQMKLTSPVAHSIARKPNVSPLFGIGSTKNISMQKFFTNKGQLTNGRHGFGSQQNLSCSSYDFEELRPVQVRSDYKGPFRRNSLSAETKIQEELKEMKAREEELRHQRTLGLSQCNLVIESEINKSKNRHNLLQRAKSNPNLSSLCDKEVEDIKEIYTRTRNTLIARWEQRIQQEESKQDNQ